MKWRKNNKYFQWGLTAFLVVASSICFYYLIFHGSNIKTGIGKIVDILMPVVFGLITAYLLAPILNFIENRMLLPLCNKLKWKESAKRSSFIRGVSIFMTIFLFCYLIYALVAMILSQIIPSVVAIANNFDTYINNFMNWLDKMLANNPDVGEYIIKTVDKYSEQLEIWLNDILLSKTSEFIKTVSLSTINVLRVLFDVIIGVIISVYLLASKEKFSGQAKKMAYALFEKNTANIVINNFRFTHKTFIGFISGKVLDSIIIGLLCFIGTSVMKTPYAALVSVVIGVTNVIPFFGPYLGAIPSALLILMVDLSHPLNCVAFVIFILVLQQFDGNFLGPMILGDSTGLTGFWVIFAITFFGGLFGVFGMIIGVPIFAVIYAAVRSFINARLMKKNMSLSTLDYISVGAVDETGFHEYIPDYRLKKSERGRTGYGTKFVSTFAGLQEQILPDLEDSKEAESEISVSDKQDEE